MKTFPTRLDSKAWCGISLAVQAELGRAIEAAKRAGLKYDHPCQCAIAHGALRELDVEIIRMSGGFND